ncbi:MAG: aspartate-semialdehyde dehydrogenase [Proteobacteria bacterium]|nr:aspartate-semialdehyde dehydrogenase [Pseudomonadota bacterium]
MDREIQRHPDGAHVAVVGATGAVGRAMLRCLDDLKLPIRKLELLASSRSAGKTLETPWGIQTIQDAETFDFQGVDIALFSAGKSVSQALAPRVLDAGCLMIDNTSAFRRDPRWPLVVPEINGELIAPRTGIIANPNCSTIQMVLALKALDDAAGINDVRVVTFQSCSGAGQKGIDALLDETRETLAGNRPKSSKVHARTMAFDVVPQIGDLLDSGNTEEEEKMMFETRKILGRPDLRVAATCVRVPVVRSHSEVVHVVTDRHLSVEQANAVLDDMAGLRVTDCHQMGAYPTAVQAEGQFDTLVGRVRIDPVAPNGLIFWIVSDNLLKGAALNAVQIACAAWNQARNCKS